MSEHDDAPGVREAFDRLRLQASGLDTMAARRAMLHDHRPRHPGLALLGAAAAAILVIAGIALFTRDDDTVRVATGDDSGPTDDATPGEPSPEALDGTTWILVAGGGTGGDLPLIEGFPITLTFDGDTLGGTAACNDYGGTFELDGTKLVIAELGATAMACEPAEVMDAETAFLQALRDVDELRVDADQLRLTGPSSRLVFERRAPVPVEELIDRLWLLTTLIEGETASSVPTDPDATLLLRSDGTLEGGTGCRSLRGEYVISGASVLFTEFAAEGDCPSELSDQDGLVVTVLGDGFTVAIDGDRLTVTSRGDEGLRYRAITEDELDELSGQDVTPDAATPPGTEPISVRDLLEQRPDGARDVEGHLVRRDGAWVLCDTLDDSVDPPRCGARWVIVTNYDAVINPHTEPPTSAEQAAIGLAEVNDDFVAAADVVWTPAPVTITLTLLDDGRAADPAWPTDVEITDADREVFEAWRALDASSAIDTSNLRLSDDGVLLGLTDELLVTRSATQLADAANWRVERDDFRARVGPFSAAELLTAADEVTLLVGPHDHCASPPAPVHPDLRELRRLSIQPTGVDSCLDWFTVDLYLDDSGDVVAVTLDLWEP